MKLTQNIKYLVVAVAALSLLSLAVAAVVLTAPEHVTGTPQATPSPTPIPTPTPTPTPTPIIPTELHLTSNITEPFYKGDTLRMTAQLNQPVAGIVVTLYNNGAALTTATTDSTGKVVFDRNPTNPFDYTATALIP